MKSEKSQIGPLFRERKFGALKTMRRNEPTFFDNTLMRILFNSAIRNSDFEAMQFVLDIGYDINEISYTGTPLSQAASNSNIELIQWILDKGANPNESSISTNPLFSAIHGGNLAAVQLFLALGIDPQKRYPCGRNALDFARIWNFPEIITSLGGNLNWKRPPWVLCSIQDFTGQRPSNEMIEAVEQELGYKMPESLKKFLLEEFPDFLFFANTQDNDDWIWLGPDHEFFHTARSLIAYNSIDARQSKKIRKYKRCFVIGTDGSGNDWCMKKSSCDNGVWSHDHETEEFILEHKSLKDFSEALLKNRSAFNNPLL